MLEIKRIDNGVVSFTGRFDASQVQKAKEALELLNDTTTMDFKDLEYISSAGLGVLVATYKRLHDKGKSVKLINLSHHIREVFRFARLDKVFQIE